MQPHAHNNAEHRRGDNEYHGADAAEQYRAEEHSDKHAERKLITTDFFQSFTMELRMSTQTATRMPANAFCTAGMWAKLVSSAAITVMITSDGETMPSVAKIAPESFFSLKPTNVAVLTAMMPGVHWPTEK